MCPGMIFSTLISSLLVGIQAISAAQVVQRAAKGSLSLVNYETLFTFRYSTDDPNNKNWIGLYSAAGGGPDNEKMDEPSLKWDWAKESSGTVHIPTDGLEVGLYKVYFLADDGYKWLAKPIEVRLADQGPVSFIVDKVTLRPARQGDEYQARINGLLRGGGKDTVKFSIIKSNGGNWAKISDSGSISGTPGPSDGDLSLTVEAAVSDSKATLNVAIPFRRPSEPLLSELKVMTYNLWMGGRNVNGYHAKQVKFIAESGVDVIAFQESTGGHARRLANALGWDSWQGKDCGIASRYPIAEKYPEGGHGGSVRIALDGQKSQINLWNVHLGYTPYGPYDFCFDKMTVEQVLKREEQSKRTPQIKQTVKDMKSHIDNANKMPVLLTGDFNAPSHLDWTKETKEQHCNVGSVPWPTSKEPINAGLVDSFRHVHPNPLQEPGITWSPIFLKNNRRTEPLDRIDFIYHKGNLNPIKAQTVVVGSPRPEPDHKDNEWTSDHKAVMITYKLL